MANPKAVEMEFEVVEAEDPNTATAVLAVEDETAKTEQEVEAVLA